MVPGAAEAAELSAVAVAAALEVVVAAPSHPVVVAALEVAAWPLHPVVVVVVAASEVAAWPLHPAVVAASEVVAWPLHPAVAASEVAPLPARKVAAPALSGPRPASADVPSRVVATMAAAVTIITIIVAASGRASRSALA